VSTSITVAYPFTPEFLGMELNRFRGQSFSEPTLYREGTKAIAKCREFRVAIEERRKLLKADSLEYGRKVDAVAKQLTDIITAVEGPLKADKLAVDNAKELAKREAAEAERRAVEEQIRAKREAEEEVLRVKRQAEEAELIAQRRALAAERAALEAQRAEAAEVARQEREELEAIRAEAKAHREAVAREQAAAEQERRAKELAEQKAAEAEEARINALEYEQARQKRLAALAPDREKLKTFRVCIDDLIRRTGEWETSDEQLKDAWDEAYHLLGEASDVLRRVE
jgi:hypothetical protein